MNLVFIVFAISVFITLAITLLVYLNSDYSGRKKHIKIGIATLAVHMLIGLMITVSAAVPACNV